MATNTESTNEEGPADLDIEDLSQRIVGGPQVEIVAMGNWGEMRFSRTEDAVVCHIAPTRVIGTAASMAMLAERLNDPTARDATGVETPFTWRADLRGFGVTASACIHLDGDRFVCCRMFIQAARDAIEGGVAPRRSLRGIAVAPRHSNGCAPSCGTSRIAACPNCRKTPLATIDYWWCALLHHWNHWKRRCCCGPSPPMS